jgi:hypothetical protein
MVKDWANISVIGPVNHPWPFIWISPEALSPPGKFETSLTLAPQDYQAFVALTKASPCSKKAAELAEWGTVRVTVFHDPTFRFRCTLSREDACSYLSQMLSLPGAGSSSKIRKEVSDLGNALTVGPVSQRLKCANFGY